MIQIFQIKCALPADSAHNCFQLCGTGLLDAAGMFSIGGGSIQATSWSLAPKQPLLFSSEINSSLSAKIGLIQASLCCMKLFFIEDIDL